jgi:DMSO/TMAO reductase YedYZ molybdopterin-dependent catalytic subunit
MARVNRRNFLSLLGGALAALALQAAGCRAPRPRRKLLRNENPPDFYIRYYRPFLPVDMASWSLRVEGLVERPLNLTLDELKALPTRSQVSRLKCVECWSAKAKWEGFEVRVLADRAKLAPEAKWVRFDCADDYFEYISLSDLLKPRVLLVYNMNGRPLSPEHGSPLRLIIPPKYGYKNVKAITKIEFVEKESLGYWARRGYSNEGTIQPGFDRALDLDEVRRIGRGEVTF